MLKGRDIRFDYIRVICMFYIVAVHHLSQYLDLPNSVTMVYNPWIRALFTNLALSLFSMISGYLIGSKYTFGEGGKKALPFYKKRIVRFYPMFFIASCALYFIGFNPLKATINGLLGIAAFVPDKPRTLWYISMIMLFYLVTPVINRNSLWWKIMSSSFFVIAACAAFKLFNNIDFRLTYNLAFYCIGLICTDIHLPFIDKNRVIISNRFQMILDIVVVLLFLGAIPISYFYLKSAFWGIILLGVVAVFALSDLLSQIKSSVVTTIVTFCSYGSMVCYMFHRVFFYPVALICNTDNQSNMGIALIIAFLICVICSYYIQKLYDCIVNKVVNSYHRQNKPFCT